MSQVNQAKQVKVVILGDSGSSQISSLSYIFRCWQE